MNSPSLLKGVPVPKKSSAEDAFTFSGAVTGLHDRRDSIIRHRFHVVAAVVGIAMLLVGCNGDGTRPQFGAMQAEEVLHAVARNSSSSAPVSQSSDRAKEPDRKPEHGGDFSSLVGGLKGCEFEGWYIDPQTGKAVNEYFNKRNMTPCETDAENEIAYFCVSENYHGIGVSKIEMQLSTAAVSRGLHFEVPVEEARRILKEELGSEFRRSARSERAESPELFVDPKDERKSLFLCVYPLGY